MKWFTKGIMYRYCGVCLHLKSTNMVVITNIIMYYAKFNFTNITPSNITWYSKLFVNDIEYKDVLHT